MCETYETEAPVEITYSDGTPLDRETNERIHRSLFTRLGHFPPEYTHVLGQHASHDPYAVNSAGTSEQLKADVEAFQELADGVPVLIWMSGSDMGCFYFNRAWLEYRGRTTEQEFGNGWAEGVHPEDLERCVQHYISSFQQRVPFAMSYRLQHHSGEYRWLLDRGAPHYAADGAFLGFYGGCAETLAGAAVERTVELRESLNEIRGVAQQIALAARSRRRFSDNDAQTLESRVRVLQARYRARENAAVQMGKLAADMLRYEEIANGACLH
jgi:PAS domain S-box-containing protein